MCRYLYLYTIIYTYMSFRNIYNNKSIYLNKLQIEKHLYIYIYLSLLRMHALWHMYQFKSKCGSCNNLCSLATVGKRPDAQPVVTVWTPVFAQRNGLLMFAAFTEMESKSLETASKDCTAHIASVLASQYKQFSSQSLAGSCSTRDASGNQGNSGF